MTSKSASNNVSSAVTTAQAQEILSQHNCARARYGLAPLTWNWQLAAAAQEWANQCIWKELPDSSAGENMALAMGAPVDMNGWLAEERAYNCAQNTCAAGQQCGHWTQVGWNSTTEVGCGIQTCASVQDAPGFLNAGLLVCRYTPPGNYIGQRMCNAAQCAQGAANKTDCTGSLGGAPKTVTSVPTLSGVGTGRTTGASNDTSTQSTTSKQEQPQQQPVVSPPAPTFLEQWQRQQQQQQQQQQQVEQQQQQQPTDTAPADVAQPQPLSPAPVLVAPDPSPDGYPPTLPQKTLSTGAIVAIALACVVLLLALIGLSYYFRHKLAVEGRRVLHKLRIIAPSPAVGAAEAQFSSAQ
jgi:hypothetical protein